MNDPDLSITHWIQRLKGGDEEAAARIWRRFFARLSALATRRLGDAAGAVDGEDLALSAMAALCDGARNDRFERLRDRDDLWSLLAVITVRKVLNARRREGRRREVAESQIAAELDALAAGTPVHGTSEEGYLDALSATSREALERLDGDLRTVALLRLHGHTNEEIAGRIGRSIPTVERRLRMVRHAFCDE